MIYARINVEIHGLTKLTSPRRFISAQVDGYLYNLAAFAPKHPGGAIIAGAGAYDASALFHSMHPGSNLIDPCLFSICYTARQV